MTPLHTHQVHPRASLNRLHSFVCSLAVITLLYRHFAAPSFLLLCLADLIFAFMWLLSQGFRWRPIRRREFPERLLQVAGNGLPALDVFVCTADPYKEPPVSVASTALSALAFDYPPDRLSVYVSDDGYSEVTLFAFLEAAKFAKQWLPFCRNNGILERSPEAYFLSSETNLRDAEEMKVMFENLRETVECAVEKGYVDLSLINSLEEKEIFNKWKNFTCKDHSSVIQVILESSKDKDITGQPLPNLIYISREKRPASPHHFKAGALNALLRISESMTDAPVILTLDCDTCSNDPNAPQRALCYLLDPVISPSLAFVQFPQRYRGLNKNDIYGCEFRQLFLIKARGLDGLQGPNYVGTGCFFSRRSLYGPPPLAPLSSYGLKPEHCTLSSEPVLQRAHDAASCKFEHDRDWGTQIGFRYGSLVEDYFTGYMLQCQGWRSVLCNPDRPAFLGDAPKNLFDLLSQMRRWAVGLYQVCFSKYCPLLYGSRKVSLLFGFCYMNYALWPIWCIPFTIYGLLPQLALFYDKPLFPKASQSGFFLYAYLFLTNYGQDFIEFMEAGGSIRRWWSDQRIWMIKGISSCTFGTMDFILGQIGVLAPGFNLTSKVKKEEENKLYDNGMFVFNNASSLFLLLGTLTIVNLSSFIFGFIKSLRRAGGVDEMLIQLFLTGFIMVNSWPVCEAMLIRTDIGKMPRSVTKLSIILAFMFFCLGHFFF